MILLEDNIRSRSAVKGKQRQRVCVVDASFALCVCTSKSIFGLRTTNTHTTCTSVFHSERHNTRTSRCCCCTLNKYPERSPFRLHCHVFVLVVKTRVNQLERRDSRDVAPLVEPATTGSECNTRDHNFQRRPKAKPSRVLIINYDHPTSPANR